MDKKNLMPQQAQPIERITTGQLPDVLAQLSEEALYGDTSTSSSVLPLNVHGCDIDVQPS
jgi:bacteriocin leader peptide (microcyclamide/patellamide family)